MSFENLTPQNYHSRFLVVEHVMAAKPSMKKSSCYKIMKQMRAYFHISKPQKLTLEHMQAYFGLSDRNMLTILGIAQQSA